MEIWTWNTILQTIMIFLGHDLIITQILGTDIGWKCVQDSECHEGNGGKYSECNKRFHVCACRINALGHEETFKTDCEDKPCTEAGYCSTDCAPKEIRKWPDGKDWYGDITVPFSSIFIQDKQTPVCFDPDRAKNSLPDGFVIKNSTIPGAGLGVFTTKYIRRDTIMGPYKGAIEPDADIAADSGYAWKLKVDSVRSEMTWVDAINSSYSNWLRYANMPNSADVENLYALQYRGEMYYQAFKSIPAGAELMVHYGDEYAEYLEISDYDPPTYYFAFKEYVGGSCYSGDGANCLHDENGICVDKTCLCKPGSYARYGACITDGTLGGRCFGADGEKCKNDPNAVCRRGICVCAENATAVENDCVLDETFAGRCSGKNGEDCKVDTNAECVDGICDCKYATTAIYGECIKDETFGGRCRGEDGDACKLDRNAQCLGKFCECKEGASEINGTCFIDETVGGKCKGRNGDRCRMDINTKCLNGRCVCSAGTSKVGNSCMQDDKVGGVCAGENGTSCKYDVNAVCVGGFCQCIHDTSAIDGKCMQDERLGGKCNSAFGWPCKLDKKSVCRNAKCVCRPGTSDVDGTCLIDGTLRATCRRGLCDGSNVVCDTEVNKCVCETEYVYHGGRCMKQQ